MSFNVFSHFYNGCSLRPSERVVREKLERDVTFGATIISKDSFIN